MGKKLKRLLKTMILIALLLYSVVCFAKQEVYFHKYDSELESYNMRISEEQLKYEQLKNTRSKVSSKEYIEEVAREKLGLVMPNEIVFIDANI